MLRLILDTSSLLYRKLTHSFDHTFTFLDYLSFLLILTKDLLFDIRFDKVFTMLLIELFFSFTSQNLIFYSFEV